MEELLRGGGGGGRYVGGPWYRGLILSVFLLDQQHCEAVYVCLGPGHAQQTEATPLSVWHERLVSLCVDLIE